VYTTWQRRACAGYRSVAVRNDRLTKGRVRSCLDASKQVPGRPVIAGTASKHVACSFHLVIVQRSTRTFLTMYLGSLLVGHAVSSQLMIKSHSINEEVTDGLVHRA
jgi:hypothetical protein